jgi:hypothetical protein
MGLFKPAWQNKNIAKAIHSLDKISDEQTLLKIASEDNGKVGEAAVKKLSDPQILLSLFAKGVHSCIQTQAIKQLKDPSLIKTAIECLERYLPKDTQAIIEGLFEIGDEQSLREIISIKEQYPRHSDRIKAEQRLRTLQTDGVANKRVLEFGNWYGQPIKWIVLASENNKMLIISMDSLIVKPFNEKTEPADWKNCTLRHWLNCEFMNTAFSSEEKAKILPTTSETADCVFLLSCQEAEKYFAHSEDRVAFYTWTKEDIESCIKIITDVLHYQKKSWNDRTLFEESYLNKRVECEWWLRTTGGDSTKAMRVMHNGTIHKEGDTVTKVVGYVRPAIWVNVAE